MQLTFGNMTLELNIFHLSNKQKPAEDEGSKSDEVFLSGTRVGRHDINKQQEELMENNEAVNEESTIPPATVSPLPPGTRLPKTRELSMKAPATHTTACVEELLLLDPPRDPMATQLGVVPARTWRPLQILLKFLLYIILSLNLGLLVVPLLLPISFSNIFACTSYLITIFGFEMLQELQCR